VKQADTWNMFRKTFKSVCTSTVVVSFDPLAPILLTSSVMQDSRKYKRVPWTSRWWTYILLECTSDFLYRPSIGAVTKTLCVVSYICKGIIRSAIFDNSTPVQPHVSWINRILLYIAPSTHHFTIWWSSITHYKDHHFTMSQPAICFSYGHC